MQIRMTAANVSKLCQLFACGSLRSAGRIYCTTSQRERPDQVRDSTGVGILAPIDTEDAGMNGLTKTAI